VWVQKGLCAGYSSGHAVTPFHSASWAIAPVEASASREPCQHACQASERERMAVLRTPEQESRAVGGDVAQLDQERRYHFLGPMSHLAFHFRSEMSTF
jgi:hypothetical protein